MALQMAQGYWPLKVMLTALVSGTTCEYSRIMLTQAMPCSRYQWPPSEKTKAARTITWVSRRMTFYGMGRRALGKRNAARG